MPAGRHAKRKLAILATLSIGTISGLAAPAPPSTARNDAPPSTSARVHVRGNARLDLHAGRGAGRLVLSGTVLDDADRPIKGIGVALGVTRADGGKPVAFADGSGVSAEPCRDPATAAAARPLFERADLLLLPADDGGHFCVRLALATDRYIAHFEARTAGVADGRIDEVRADMPIDLSLDSIGLRFDPELPTLSLDDEATILQVVASVEGDGVTRSASGLPIVLSNEAGALLASATTDGAGHARFVVPSESLGPPGPGELRISFAGNAQAGTSSRAMRVERRTRVDLSAPDAVDGRLPAGSPEDGIGVSIVARARCARCSLGAAASPGVPTGAIEAHLGEGNAIVGAASLEGARAHVVATFPWPAPAATDGETVLRLRFIPDAPWFLPGAELRLAQPLRAPSTWTRFPLLLAGALVLLWLMLSRWQVVASGTLTSSNSSRPPQRSGASAVRPELAVVRADSTRGGWTGRVVDAHDGSSVAGAHVSVQRRGFERIETLASTTTSREGHFELPARECITGDELVAEGPLHGELRRPVPPSGELKVALVMRRRALLERLVRWARRRGKPFDAGPEPTPGHVRRAAASEFAIARWADAVERAAFAGGPVDRNIQAEVDHLAPPDAPSDALDAADAGKGARAQPRPAERPAARKRPRR